MKKTLTTVTIALAAINANAEQINLRSIVSAEGYSRTYKTALDDSIKCTAILSEYDDHNNPGYDVETLKNLFSEYVKYIVENSSEKIELEELINKNINKFNASLKMQDMGSRIKFLNNEFENCYYTAGLIIAEIENKQNIKFEMLDL